MQLFTHLLSSYLQGMGDFFSALPVSVRSLLPSTTAVWIETTVVVVIVVRHLGGVRAGLMGVALSALNTINCDRKSGKHTRE